MLRHLLVAPRGTRADFTELVAAAERAGLPRAALTSGWTVSEIRSVHDSVVRAALPEALANEATIADGIAIASALLNVDTSRAGRLAVQRALRGVVARDSLELRAQYQIGRISAVTGEELDAGASALAVYVRHPAPLGAPSHASAYWRLGQIEEHRGRLDRARAAYLAALEREPSHAAALAALARLRPSER